MNNGAPHGQTGVPDMTSLQEKGGGGFSGLKLLLCENPLPPLDEAIDAARAELPRSNHYTEAHSAPLRRLLASTLDLPERLIHINAGSEIILRQIFDRFGQRVHLLTPTYPLFPEIARHYTETPLPPDKDFRFDLSQLRLPSDTTLAVVVNPNNPNGLTFNVDALPALLRRHPSTFFLVDEAFIGLAGDSVAHLVPGFENLLVTRTLSKAHSLAGFRVGYAVLPEAIADDLNDHNDAYPLARPSEAAAVATLQNQHRIRERAASLRRWTEALAADLRTLGVRTYPTETYFFLADFSPLDAGRLAAGLKERGILVKALNDVRLGPGFMRITTALPDDNNRFLSAIEELTRIGAGA
jgi:histidinol-phosphate aminotransferase